MANLTQELNEVLKHKEELIRNKKNLLSSPVRLPMDKFLIQQLDEGIRADEDKMERLARVQR